LGSAIFTWGYGNWVWQTLTFWRFVLGIGVGGTYPLTAVFAGEMVDERGLGRTGRVSLSIAVQIVRPPLPHPILCTLLQRRRAGAQA